ncbi:hypothetical protein AB0E27_24290 [Streptomyces sparsogenes]|uniref:hypothetical protein n=1 Tax=Streptomyces sparsogenes TaxID=67365 RepID=UPI0033E7FE01
MSPSLALATSTRETVPARAGRGRPPGVRPRAVVAGAAAGAAAGSGRSAATPGNRRGASGW